MRACGGLVLIDTFVSVHSDHDMPRHAAIGAAVSRAPYVARIFLQAVVLGKAQTSCDQALRDTLHPA